MADRQAPCARWREAISARHDGEDPSVDVRLLEAHLSRCPGCRRFATMLGGGQLSDVGPVAADAAPDVSGRVAKLTALADRAASWSAVRVLLAVVAVEIIAVSLRALVLGVETATSTHAARHLGAFTVAYAVGLLVVVARPARARTMLPVAAVLAGALVISAIVDLVNRRIPLIDETMHLPEVASVVLVWLLAVPRSPRRRGRERPPATKPALRVVDNERRAG